MKDGLAGFIDGEGCFNIGKVRTCYFPRLLIVNTDLNVLRMIKEQYGGDITSRRNGKENWKTFNIYRASHKAFREIMNDVYPYLILKKKQVDLCFEILNTKDMAERLVLKEQMHLLNKKGI